MPKYIILNQKPIHRNQEDEEEDIENNFKILETKNGELSNDGIHPIIFKYSTSAQIYGETKLGHKNFKILPLIN